MPVRGSKTSAPTRKVGGARPTKEEVEEMDKDETPNKGSGKKTVVKNPFKERFLKYLEEVEKGLSEKLQEVTVKKVAEIGQAKVDIAFVVFGEDGIDGEVDHKFNEQKIKDVLLHYHTAVDEGKGAPINVQVVAPLDKDTPYILAWQQAKIK